MTNAEKFKEVFGFQIDEDICLGGVQCEKCACGEYRHEYDEGCSNKWWQSEYKENKKAEKAIKKRGYWKKGDYWSHGCGMGETYGYYYKCSECENLVKGDYDKCRDKYCSKCGADMRGE